MSALACLHAALACDLAAALALAASIITGGWS
jgi:hypothetical protein